MGYYLPEYNFSVEFYKGSWIQRIRLDEDQLALGIAAKVVEEWAQSNREKFHG